MTDSTDAHQARAHAGAPADVPAAEEGLDYDLQQNIGYLLRTTNQVAVSRFNQYTAQVLGVENITTTQFAVLTSIQRFPGTTFSALSDFTSIDLPTLASMVNRLSGRGLVQVEVNPKDKRSRKLFLLPKGEELADYLTRHGNEIGDFIATGLTASELRRLKQLLRKMWPQATPGSATN